MREDKRVEYEAIKNPIYESVTHTYFLPAKYKTSKENEYLYLIEKEIENIWNSDI